MIGVVRKVSDRLEHDAVLPENESPCKVQNMRVEVEIDLVTLENDSGREIESVCATCLRCDHTTESFGTSERSRRRCLVLLKEECPLNEDNYYIDPDAEEWEDD